MRTTPVKPSRLPWVSSATRQVDWATCSKRRLKKVCNLSCGPELDEGSARVVLASKAVARGAVLVDSVQGVGCMAQDLEMAVLEGEGVQDVPEVTAARAGDSSSTFASFGGQRVSSAVRQETWMTHTADGMAAV